MSDERRDSNAHDDKPRRSSLVTRHTYPHPKANRIGGRGSFKRVLDQGKRVWDGQIGMGVTRSAGKSSRLGISIGRPVGNAVKRNRIKRLLRESFRHMQHDWPMPCDVIVLVRPHETKSFKEYQEILLKLSKKCLSKLTPSKD